jgi:hypothetical protein
MSGHATWNLGLHYTTYFAAINPLSGGAKGDWQRLRIMNMRNVTSIVWHDATDKFVPVDESRNLVRILKNFKCPVDYEETKLLGHMPSAEIIQRTYKKLREVSRDLYPAAVCIQSTRPESAFNRLDWVQMYQPIKPGEEKKMRMAHGSGTMTVFEYTFTAKAERKSPNRFEVTTDNVDTMRLLFNDQMVDFAKPVTVVVNNRVRFEAIMKPSIDEMLKDQLNLGRGWRYFTAILDIDVTKGGGTPVTSPTRPATTRKGTIEVGPSR